MCHSEKLYTIRKDIKCVQCGNIGGVQYYGTFYPNGINRKSTIIPIENQKEKYMDYAVGFGGTIPYHCMNCNSQGLIDIDGLEGYSKLFETIKKDES